MNIDWSMVGAIAGIIAVLLVVIIEADRLFPRLAKISEYLAAAILATYMGALLLMVVGGTLFGLVSLFVEFPPGFMRVGRSVGAIIIVVMGAGSITVGLAILLKGEAQGFTVRYGGWKRFLLGFAALAVGILIFYLIFTGKAFVD